METEAEAVIFDLDDTLCVREQSLDGIIGAVFERVDAEPFYTPADIHAVDYDDLPSADSRRGFYENSIRAIAEEVGADPSHAPTLADATVEVVDETAVTFREGAREAFEYAREHYDVGLITNGGTEIQTAKLENLGIEDAFDTTVFCSSGTGVASKPDPEPFELALTDLDAAAETTVMIGDSHGEDIVGAHGAGLRSIWVPRGGDETDPEPAPTWRLDSMGELAAIL